MKESTDRIIRKIGEVRRRTKSMREAVTYPSPDLEEYVLATTFVKPSSITIGLLGTDGYIFDVITVEELLRNGYKHKGDYEIIISDVDGLVAKVPPSNCHPRKQARVTRKADDEVIESTMSKSLGKKTKSIPRRKLR